MRPGVFLNLHQDPRVNNMNKDRTAILKMLEEEKLPRKTQLRCLTRSSSQGGQRCLHKV